MFFCSLNHCLQCSHMINCRLSCTSSVKCPYIVLEINLETITEILHEKIAAHVCISSSASSMRCDRWTCLNIWFSPVFIDVGGLYLCRRRLLSGGVTEAAVGASTTRGRERWRRGRGWLRPWGAVWPQPVGNGTSTSTRAGGAQEAARTPGQGAGDGQGQVAAGGDPGHCTRSAQNTRDKITLLMENLRPLKGLCSPKPICISVFGTFIWVFGP